jgi:hypothetical protein
MNRFSNPKYTIALLKVLQLTDAEWKEIHYRKGPTITVANHIEYAGKTKIFPENGKSAVLAQRLEEMMLRRLYETTKIAA